MNRNTLTNISQKILSWCQQEEVANKEDAAIVAAIAAVAAASEAETKVIKAAAVADGDDDGNVETEAVEAAADADDVDNVNGGGFDIPNLPEWADIDGNGDKDDDNDEEMWKRVTKKRKSEMVVMKFILILNYN